MSGSQEEEIYSVMFSSLRHPARRKILRMLSEKSMSFSEILEELEVPSSHLTYHLENLGDLVVKGEEGKYKLSSFGKASVVMMKGAEEVPEANTKQASNFFKNGKLVYAILLIALVFLASLSFVQFASFNRLTSDYNALEAGFENVKVQNQALLGWRTSAVQAMAIIKDVVQIDVSKYQVTLESDVAETRSDLGGVVEEVMKYSLINSQSRIELTLRFRNSHFSLLQLTQLEGLPNYPLLYTQRQPSDPLEAASGLLSRYKSVMNDSYLNEAATLLASANKTVADQTLGNTKLQLSSYGDNAEVLVMFTESGTDFAAKSLHMVFENRVLKQFSDDWFLFKVGNTQVNVTKEQAMLIAKNAAKDFSWTVNGTKVAGFEIVDSPVSAEFYPHSKTSNLTLIPYWYVTLYLDKTYPGGVNVIAVGVWADTGEIANIQALGDQPSL
jgi:DNA-binding transcriptional ArsR family regulator